RLRAVVGLVEAEDVTVPLADERGDGAGDPGGALLAAGVPPDHGDERVVRAGALLVVGLLPVVEPAGSQMLEIGAGVRIAREPLERLLARAGWLHPAADGAGDLDREALRRLVAGVGEGAVVGRNRAALPSDAQRLDDRLRRRGVAGAGREAAARTGRRPEAGEGHLVDGLARRTAERDVRVFGAASADRRAAGRASATRRAARAGHAARARRAAGPLRPRAPRGAARSFSAGASRAGARAPFSAAAAGRTDRAAPSGSGRTAGGRGPAALSASPAAGRLPAAARRGGAAAAGARPDVGRRATHGDDQR